MLLKDVPGADKETRYPFKVHHAGTPAMPVTEHFMVMRRNGFFW